MNDNDCKAKAKRGEDRWDDCGALSWLPYVAGILATVWFAGCALCCVSCVGRRAAVDRQRAAVASDATAVLTALPQPQWQWSPL